MHHLPALSIVIPTHKRAETLKECMRRLEAQTMAHELEVIVVSDGHDAQTAQLMNEATWKIPVKFIEIEKSQQGIARNRGVQEATAKLVMFIGDDIFLAPDCCAMHLKAHHKLQTTRYELPATSPHPIAILGITTWDPALQITPAMRWLEETGWQFGYPLLKAYRHAFIPAHMQHRFTYSSHISLPTSVAKNIPFRSDVSLYGWEDIVWGQQLRSAGVSLYYEPDAVALHHHHVSLDDSLARMETLGKSLVYITQIAPELDRTPVGWKMIAYRLIARTPTMRGKHYQAFIKGLSS